VPSPLSPRSLFSRPLVSAGSASADQLRYRDATHDVVKIDLADDSGTPVTDRGATNGDIKPLALPGRDLSGQVRRP
jgi:hypothetical protein